MLRFFEKMVFSGCKSQIFFIGDQNAGRGDRMTEARRCSERQGDCFAGPGGNSANLEARRSFLRGSWRLSTPSLTHPIKMYVVRMRKRDTCLQLYSVHCTYHTCTLYSLHLTYQTCTLCKRTLYSVYCP